jgi:single-stranded-DNA-specific exonuclease
MNQARWILTQVDEELRRKTNLDGLTLSILSNRGYKTPEEIDEFMNLRLSSLHGPSLMKDSLKAVKAIINSIQNKEKIVVYGDFDCDGSMSIVTVYSAIKNLGGDISYYTNSRFVEGYQVSPEGVKNILKVNPDTKLIITADNGIGGHDMVDFCKKNNIKVVITDHHIPGKSLPKAEAVVDPKRQDCPYPFKELCGAGVAWKLMYLLYKEMDKDLSYVYELLDIVALATVADVVPLVDENRVIVKEGLKLMRKEKRNIFKILREETDVTEITAHYTIGFVYGPMINAEGRIDGKPNRAIKMFLEHDEGDVREYVRYLIKINSKRKSATKTQTKVAYNLVEMKGEVPHVILVRGPFHEGVVGLIAGRLREKYYRPTIVLTQANGVWKGSARSIDAFHMKNALDATSELLIGYGGHSQAAGLSIEGRNIFKFEKAINEFAKTNLTEEDLIPSVIVDHVVEDKISYEMIETVNKLEPYGKGFEYPVFAVKNFNITSPSYMGQNKKYAKLYTKSCSIVMWNEEDVEKYKGLGEPKNLRVVGCPEVNTYKGEESLQFRVLDYNWMSL